MAKIEYIGIVSGKLTSVSKGRGAFGVRVSRKIKISSKATTAIESSIEVESESLFKIGNESLDESKVSGEFS